MRFLLKIILIVISVTPVLSQSILERCDYMPPHEADIWYFYSNSGLDFNGGTVTPLLDNFVLDLGNSTSVISDEGGNLLFFTDGQMIWDRTFQVMPFATGLHGNAWTTQSSVIVHSPGSANIYYVFTNDKYTGNPQEQYKGMSFNISDMNENGGLGDVVQPNIELLDECTEKLTAVKHGNGEDVWVLAHGWNGADANSFYAWLVSKSGVDQNAVVSNVGYSHNGTPDDNVHAGYMKTSSDGSKIALVIYGKGIVEVLDFDNNTGMVSSPKTSAEIFDYIYGVEFSPNANRLYTTTTPSPYISPRRSYVFQFDVSPGVSNPFFDYDTIATFADTAYTSVQLGTDGKIYIGKFYGVLDGNEHLAVIENPNRPGSECNFVEHGVYLDGRQSKLGLPNFMQSYVDIPHFLFKGHCFDNDTASFWLNNESNIQSLQWDFGDPSSGSNTGSGFYPQHFFSQPGSFNVSVTETFNGQDYTFNEDILVYPMPNVSLGPDTLFLYPGASFTLDAGNGFDYYFWNGSDESTSRYFTASDTGMYYVTVVDLNCCYNSDSVLVIPSGVYLPNAFTPNNDGVNDVFEAKVLAGGILNFNMMIFSRWGQLVFESNDYFIGWDGTTNGEELPSGVYVYRVSYDVELDFGKYEEVLTKGQVTLLK